MLRVVESFSGIGSQAKALSNAEIPHEIVHTIEWDVNAILAYSMIHNRKIDIDKYQHISDEEILEFLKKQTLSLDGKKPMDKKTLPKMSDRLQRILYTAIKDTHNLVSITDVKGMEIPENIDLFTYSFPCQDLSLCGCWHGNKSGIAREACNRSGMLWQVERILKEMYEGGRRLPRFLLMENVPNILSKQHAADFGDWKETLQKMGYTNKIYRLTARNFGIPQKRERAYMISILCNENRELDRAVQGYFAKYNLEDTDYANKQKRRQRLIKDVLRLDYRKTLYRIEAEFSTPNDTPSRRKILNDNDILYSNGQVHEMIVNAVTTKQDRNPNSGVIMYDSVRENKAPFRYLTPRECFMLMGFDEDDYERVISINMKMPNGRMLYSTEKLIKMAGNSIVVDVLEAIFKQINEINNLFFVSSNRDENIDKFQGNAEEKQFAFEYM